MNDSGELLEAPTPEQLQKATFNILEDFDVERARTNDIQRATFNILEDFEQEKSRIEDTQRATFNILDDLAGEKAKVDKAENELAKRADDLSRSNSDLERFAHVVSHDLQEPIRTITGYLQLVEKSTRGKLDDNSARYIQNALDGTVRIKQMILDILTFARAGNAEMRTGQVDLATAYEGAMNGLELLISDKNAQVTHTKLPRVVGDESLLSQVLQNLIGNGLKFQPADQKPVIHVASREDRDQWIISVTDNGLGIDATDLHRLFVPFQRLHSAAEFAGSGIGLANCRRIIERHGGRTWIDSTLGKGTTVSFTLPIKQETT